MVGRRMYAYATAVLLTCVGLLSCDSSDNSAQLKKEWLKLEHERIELANQVDVLQLRLDRFDAKRRSETLLKESRERIVADQSKIALLERTGQQLKSDIAALERQMILDQNQYLAGKRAAYIGASYPDLKTQDGRMFRDVTIVAITDSGVQIRHREGAANLGCDDLDPGQQEKFGLSMERFLKALAQEEQLAKHYDAALAQSSIKKKPVVEMPPVTSPVPPVRPFPLVALSSVEPSKATSPLHEPPRDFGGVRRQRVRNFYHYLPYAAPCCNSPVVQPAGSCYERKSITPISPN